MSNAWTDNQFNLGIKLVGIKKIHFCTYSSEILYITTAATIVLSRVMDLRKIKGSKMQNFFKISMNYF